mmetsp:Transcript_21250/g.50510  ORF Transcript_21250/g.50510 Transcript_21250/m.50510 type:complete len:203 (-) Transcript_21250:316-924(-)
MSCCNGNTECSGNCNAKGRRRITTVGPRDVPDQPGGEQSRRHRRRRLDGGDGNSPLRPSPGPFPKRRRRRLLVAARPSAAAALRSRALGSFGSVLLLLPRRADDEDRRCPTGGSRAVVSVGVFVAPPPPPRILDGEDRLLPPVRRWLSPNPPPSGERRPGLRGSRPRRAGGYRSARRNGWTGGAIDARSERIRRHRRGRPSQ